ncbi:hypothetical protein [Streptomyces sp. NPDC090022]|uniref:hypothetical protein n=1 Tax=Streptomyces sp. NPDC090022 TaxID=3365920 RepID=UPI00380EF9BC
MDARGYDGGYDIGALGRAAALEKAARRGSGWYERYLMVFGAGQLVLVPMVLLWHGAGALVFAVAHGLLVAALSVYAARQRAVRRGFGVRHVAVVGVWGMFFAVTVILGTTVFVDQVPFAVGGTLLCALPVAVGLWNERRRSS